MAPSVGDTRQCAKHSVEEVVWKSLKLKENSTHRWTKTILNFLKLRSKKYAKQIIAAVDSEYVFWKRKMRLHDKRKRRKTKQKHTARGVSTTYHTTKSKISHTVRFSFSHTQPQTARQHCDHAKLRRKVKWDVREDCLHREEKCICSCIRLSEQALRSGSTHDKCIMAFQHKSPEAQFQM